MNSITLESKNVNKKIWAGFDEEFFRAEEEFYAHKYNFAENVVFSSLQRKIDKLAFEFGLGAGVVDTEVNNLHNVKSITRGKKSDRVLKILRVEDEKSFTSDSENFPNYFKEEYFSDKNSYAQYVDKYISLGGKLGEIVGWLNEHGYDKEAQAVAVCGAKTNAVDLRCPAEHRYAKQIFCGRQYCVRCGEEDSVIHQRRYSRSWEKLMWAPALGRIVLTVPEEIRNDFKNIDKLGKLHKAGWACAKEVWGRDIVKEGGEIEKEISIDGAMTTVHFFGDRGGKKFHPHVNVTFPILSGKLRVSKERLEALRNRWYDILKKLTGKEISLTEDGRERKNAWYGYRDTEGKKAHWLKYVLRSTVGAERFLRLDEGVKEFVVTSLVGHNVRWFGRLSNRNFKKYKKDCLENAPFYQEFLTKKSEKLRDFKYCPICHGRLKVHKHKGKIEILEGIHKTWHELSVGFWCDEVTYQILVRKGLVGADGRYTGSSP